MSSNPSATIYHDHIRLNNRAVSVWFAVSLFACFQFCTQVIAGPMTRELMETFSLNAVTVSYAVSSFFYIYLIMQLPAGLILDRCPNNYVLPVTCFICALGCIFMGLADNVYSFIFARMLCGFGSAFGFIGTMRVLRNYFPLRYIGLFIGFTEMMGFFVTASCENLVSYFLPIVGFENIFIYLGCMGLLVALWIYLAMHKKLAPDYELAPAIKNDNVIADLKELLQDKTQWTLGLIAFCFFSLVTAFAALWGVPSLVNMHKFSLQTSTQVISAIFIGIAIGGPTVGYINTKITRHSRLIFWCGIICAILMFAVTFMNTTNPMAIAVLFFICGILSCCYLLCFAVANEITPARLSGTTMGLLNMITMASALIMQPVMGYLVSLNGPIDFINGAPIYESVGYQRACFAIVLLFLLASFLSTRLNIKNAHSR